MRSHRCPPPRRRRCISQFPITAIREIKILKILNHKNVVRLKEIVTSKGADYNQGKGSIYMVMEFCDHDLTGLTDAGSKFTVPQIKCYMKQLLEGLAYCHAQKVLHRDIKGSNLLINNEGQLKLADFGLARPYDTDQQRPYTNRVITLWYRPPELLLGATMYGPAIDMWSAGCIFAELLLRKPILPGKNEFEQIDLIFKLLGTPDETTWPGCKSLQYYDMILSQTSRKYQSRFEEKFATLDPTAKDLLRKLLAMDPNNRLSADDALDHEYFWSDPVPATPDMLPKYPPSHEFTTKKRRQKEAQQFQQQQQQQPASQQYSSQHAPPSQHNAFARNQPIVHPYNGQHQPMHYPQQQQYAPQGAYYNRGYAPQQAMPGAKRYREGGPAAAGGFFDSSAPSNGGYATFRLSRACACVCASASVLPYPPPRQRVPHMTHHHVSAKPARARVALRACPVPHGRPRSPPRTGLILRTRPLCALSQASPARGFAPARAARPRHDAIEGAQRQRERRLPCRRMATRLGLCPRRGHHFLDCDGRWCGPDGRSPSPVDPCFCVEDEARAVLWLSLWVGLRCPGHRTAWRRSGKRCGNEQQQQQRVLGGPLPSWAGPIPETIETSGEAPVRCRKLHAGVRVQTHLRS